ncbi:hypothetical protein HW115_05105 [Verrucomicrobiaceae bacterium N1E253]|uniref:Uncharacterized protein n=1 Tax=Oceaniferula marina TaxID=2748318 RepID=A0A851GC26_9BACT|nr:hypothetical protein [Oceaniferula marina]NWK54976.1 hypothetical protein [Oceaniferula marina]
METFQPELELTSQDEQRLEWIRFYFDLGRHVARLERQHDDPVNAIITVPFVNFASTLISAGIISEKFIHSKELINSSDLSRYKDDQAVSFGYQKIGHAELKKVFGLIDGIDRSLGVDRLEVAVIEDEGNRHFTRFIQPDWLHLVQPVDDAPDLIRFRPGSLIAQNVKALTALIGLDGTRRLLQHSHHTCLIIDIIGRVSDELRAEIPLMELGLETEEVLYLRDLIRPSCAGPEGIRDSYCSMVSHNIEDGWDASVICGSLNYINHWEDCYSSLKVGVLGTSEPHYKDALEQANEGYYQRVDDLPGDDELNKLCPALVDFQIFTY